MVLNMQGLQHICLADQPARNDGYAQQTAYNALVFNRRKYLTGRTLVDVRMTERTLERGGYVAKSRRGRVCAARVNRAVRENVALLNDLDALVQRIKEEIWYAGPAQVYQEEGPDQIGRCGRITLRIRTWIGRVCIDVSGPETDMFLVGGGKSTPIRAPGLCVALVDDAGGVGRCGLQSLTGDADPLADMMREALYNAPLLIASLVPEETSRG